MNPRELVQQLVDRALKAGAGEAEVYLEDSQNTRIKAFSGQIESLIRARGRGVGLRVIRDGRAGFSYTTDLSPPGLEDLVRIAASNAAWSGPDSDIRLPDPETPFPELDLFDPEIELLPVQDKIQIALDLEKAALAHDRRIQTVTSAGFGDRLQEVCLANSRGVKGSFRTAHASVALVAVASDGGLSPQTGYSFSSGRRWRDLNWEAVAGEAATKAVSLLGARPVSSVEVPVIFDPFAGAEIIGQIGRALTGEAVRKGKSLFAGREGERVASSLVTLVDDGLMMEGLAAAPFDGEGVPSRKKDLVSGGRLLGLLHNTYSSSRAGTRSTGNGHRGSFRQPPEVAPSNFYLAAGRGDLEDLWRGLTQGFYVMEVSGLSTGGLSVISGDLSVGAAGRWIVNGELGPAVREVTIAGNVIEMLSLVDAVSGKVRMLGSAGAPAFRVSKMIVSGKES